MSKRALLIAFHFPPQASSSGIQRTLSFSRYLGDEGWEPLVLSASPRAYAVTNPSQLSSVPPSLVVRRAFALDAKRHMGLFGHYSELTALPDRWASWWLSAVPAGLSLVRKYRPDVIWSTFPIATSHLIGYTLHKMTGIPWIADFRDPMLQPSYPTTRLQRNAFGWIEQRAIQHAQRAVFTTHAACDAYRQRFPDRHEKFSVIENGYDEDVFSGIATSEMDNVPRKDGPIVLLHSGVLYQEGRDPSAFFAALSALKRQGRAHSKAVRIILRATGDDKHFIGLAQKHDVADLVAIAPAVPYRDALREMLQVDGLLVFQGTPFNNQIPAKIYEYFRARKPIFGLVDTAGETARVLTAAGYADLAPMNCARTIETALDSFLSSIRQGSCHIANDSLVAASSRQHRATQLAQLFNAAVPMQN